MIIKVKLLPQEKKFKNVTLKDGSRGQELLDKLGLAPDAHILARERDPIPLDEELKEGEEISVIQVISGG